MFLEMITFWVRLRQIALLHVGCLELKSWLVLLSDPILFLSLFVFCYSILQYTNEGRKLRLINNLNNNNVDDDGFKSA